MSILLTIAFEAKPDKLAAFLQLLATVKAELPGTAGCEDIRILQKIDEPTSVSLIETWGSRVEHQAHVEAIVANGGWDHVMSHLASPPVSFYFQEA